MASQPRIEESTPIPLLEQMLFEVKKGDRGPGEAAGADPGGACWRGATSWSRGVPGLAKTLAIRSMAQVVSGEFNRIQFTPDLVPADLVGTRIYNQGSGEFTTSLGPVFTNLLLADEINRAPAKVQSALLEVMQEHQVTIGRETHRVPEPFLVLATQNPIETEGTYALPEAQVGPLHAEGACRLPERPRGARDRPADDERAAGAAPDRVDGGAAGAAEAGERGLLWFNRLP